MAFLILAGAAIDLGLASCVSTVRPPTDPQRPVTVYLRREALHAALLLPRPAGGIVEYGFGDYDWYALGKDRWYHVFDTLLLPTRGTLARRDLPVEGLAELKASYPASNLTPIVVGADAAARLEARLDAEYRERQDTEIYNPEYALHFVVHEDGFWLFYNCHDALARWLRELGCSVGWTPVRGGLRAAPPRPSRSRGATRGCPRRTPRPGGRQGGRRSPGRSLRAAA
jgi:hypothetical protein